jgi:general secretion pathway protein G
MQELENSVWKTVDVLTGRTPSSSECIGDLRQMKGISHCEARRVMTPRSTTQERGFTLLELIVAATILAILTLMALPLARVTIKRQKEKQLRHALWDMRDAIDHYKDAADRGGFQIKADSFGYPPSLEDLVKGVDVGGKKMRFLRKIPIDPMTRNTEWGLRSMQDDPDSDSWGGQNVFDVYTKSEGTAFDGTKYKDW